MTQQPLLIIFDIDSTLIKPGRYNSPEQVYSGLYDPQLLTEYLHNPTFQVALASFNQDSLVDRPPYGGRRLGRLILQVQGDSSNVQDDFIQSWIYPTAELCAKHGKNEHIRRILIAYRQKYNRMPSQIIFYDDHIENVYLACKNGINAYWVRTGLTRTNINTFTQIRFRVRFTVIQPMLENYIFSTLHVFVIAKNNNVYSLYLPGDQDIAQKVYAEFLQRIRTFSISINVVESDINYIV